MCRKEIVAGRKRIHDKKAQEKNPCFSEKEINGSGLRIALLGK